MDTRHSVRLHRCRFLDWSPSPITALAFPPALQSSKKLHGDAHPVLAVGRANGNIELWRWASSKPTKIGAGDTNQGWVMHQVRNEILIFNRSLRAPKTSFY
jgi:U3 small nucleolar RNA-associated protein 4